MATIGICIATYQGDKFLNEQLESIASQSYQDWHLHVRDDGSTDDTPAILEAFRARFPSKVSIVYGDARQLGASGNFAHLMRRAKEPYVAFADQDDVWYPDKLARAIEAVKLVEAASGPSTPVMIHADRRLINASGRERTASYWDSRGLEPARFYPETHFTFCLAAGATMLINRALCDLALPIPAAARMYDCWIELVAHMFGKVVALEGIALDHRRHDSNASGSAADIDSPAARRGWSRAARLLQNTARQRRIYVGYLEQAAAFRDRFSDILNPDQARRLNYLLSLPNCSLPARLYALRASRAGPPGLARKLATVLLVDRTSFADGTRTY
jgi:glycosyltransferase involved in cell wall biosynthesis